MLLGNQSLLTKCPVRFMAGSTSSVEVQLRSNWNQAGRNRNQLYRSQETVADPLWAVPSGMYPNYTWLISESSGRIASHDNAVIGIAPSATLYGGVTATSLADFAFGFTTTATRLPADDSDPARTASATIGLDGSAVRLPADDTPPARTASASIGIDVNTPTMLPSDTSSPLRTGSTTFSIDFPAFTTAALTATVQPGDAPSEFGISTNNPLLSASINGVGSVSFGLSADTTVMLPSDDTSPLRTGNVTISIDTNTPLIGAIASVIADGFIGMTGTATRLPSDDSPPARTASASFDISGALTPYAVGNMVGTTAEAGVTVDNVVNGVWRAILANYPTVGSAGNTLALAGSGGVDYASLANAVWTSVSRTLTDGAAPSAATISAAVWSEVSRTLTASGDPSASAIAAAVWSEVSRTLTSASPPSSGDIATAVWSAISRTLTASSDPTAVAISAAVWSEMSRTLTSSPPPSTGDIATAVWANISRTLTAGAAPSTVDIVNAIVAAIIPVNVKYMNDEALIGDGSSSNKFRSHLVP